MSRQPSDLVSQGLGVIRLHGVLVQGSAFRGNSFRCGLNRWRLTRAIHLSTRSPGTRVFPPRTSAHLHRTPVHHFRKRDHFLLLLPGTLLDPSFQPFVPAVLSF
jgi:hypothetical protein